MFLREMAFAEGSSTLKAPGCVSSRSSTCLIISDAVLPEEEGIAAWAAPTMRTRANIVALRMRPPFVFEIVTQVVEATFVLSHHYSPILEGRSEHFEDSY
jgi:hypothetical protein